MKDTKSLTLLLLSSVLFLLSIIFLCTWAYQYYNQINNNNPKPTQPAVVAPTAPPVSSVSDDTRDSLLKIYRLTLSTFGSSVDTTYYVADSLKGQLNINMQEFYRLREEIALLLKQQKPNSGDLVLARKKITELQQRVDDLRYRNTDVEKENKRLKLLIEQLSKGKSGTNTASSSKNGGIIPNFDKKIDNINNNNKGSNNSTTNDKGKSGTNTNGKTITPNKNPAVTPQVNSTPSTSPVTKSKVSIPLGSVTAYSLHLYALTSKDNESVTNAASSADKIVGTFVVKNNSSKNGWCDYVVVVTDPNGQVLQKSAWDVGTFQTTEGKRIYSAILHFEIEKGASKQMSFSLSPDEFPKGNYTMTVYCNGKVVGRTIKTLS